MGPLVVKGLEAFHQKGHLEGDRLGDGLHCEIDLHSRLSSNYSALLGKPGWMLGEADLSL